MITRSARRLALFGAGVYILFVVATFPASVALGLFLPDGVTVQSARGTLWNGEADSLYTGTFMIPRVAWNTHGLALLTGKVAATIDAQLPDGRVQGRIGTAVIGDTLTGKDIRAVLPLGALRDSLPLSGVDGRLWLQLDQIKVEDGWPSRLAGAATLDGLTVSLPVAVELGSFEIKLSRRDDGTLVGAFEDAEATLETYGEALIVQGQYRIEGRARPNGPGPIADTLKFLGVPDAEGFYPINFEGTF